MDQFRDIVPYNHKCESSSPVPVRSVSFIGDIDENPGTNCENVLYIVNLSNKYTRALTFENF